MEALRCKKKYGFVVLHYMAYEMTVECVSNLIQKFNDYDIHIAVVDNASPNDSGKKLEQLYKEEEKVTILLNKNNDGFARGNNLGYRYLIENKNLDYIIVMNNDVLIEQNDFLDLTDKIYLNTSYAVLGPDIYCPATKKHQNPAHLQGFDIKEVKSLDNLISKYCDKPAFYYYKHATLGRIKRFFVRNNVEEEKKDYLEEKVNVVLHGACYIFSKEYINRRKEYCFFPDTFLYMEEDILYFECKRDQLKILYSPEIRVKHLEDVSTDASIKSGFKKFKMKNEEMKKSIGVLLKLMKDEK